MSEANNLPNESMLSGPDLTPSQRDDEHRVRLEGEGAIADCESTADVSLDRHTGDQEQLASPDEDWATVDFPDAVSVDAIPHEATTEAATPAESQLSELEAANLIQLVQDLNHCNRSLLQRIQELETALEASQSALQTEVARSQELAEAHNPQELAEANERALLLFNQLEAVQQSGHRQQILVETLTEQLESSQERVAQLERECALLQQSYNQQAHLLLQSSNTCRDLRTRLQRQQRYTLQFKAALEKCLEVPPPRYEVSERVDGVDPLDTSEAAVPEAGTAAFLPKVKQIQPWSSQPGFLSENAEQDQEGDRWLNLELDQKEPDPSEANPSEANASGLDLSHLTIEELAMLPASESEPEANPEIPPQQSTWMQMAGDVISPAPVEPEPISYEIGSRGNANANPADGNLDAAIAAESLGLDLWDEVLPPAQAAPETAAAEAIAALNDPSQQSASGLESQPMPEVTDFDELPHSEDALWHDLAKLIDVSTEDVIRASQTDEFTEFEAQPLTPERPESSSTPTPTPEEALAAQSTSSASEAERDSQRSSSDAEPVSDPLTPHANSPSPIVYPLRSPKKIPSLAAVKLPTFPHSK